MNSVCLVSLSVAWYQAALGAGTGMVLLLGRLGTCASTGTGLGYQYLDGSILVLVLF